jgi:hypothetical protein
MQWLALACTAENEVLAWADSLAVLESACALEFRAICRVYGIDEEYANDIKQGKLNYRLEFDGPRNTNCVKCQKDEGTQTLSQILQARVGFMHELYQRLTHGYRRFSPVVEWQLEAYEMKYQAALMWENSDVFHNLDVGTIHDYADETGIDREAAVGIIINKYENRQSLIRKLERLRIRHQTAIRKAKSKEDFVALRSAMDEDSFLSMLM